MFEVRGGGGSARCNVDRGREEGSGSAVVRDGRVVVRRRGGPGRGEDERVDGREDGVRREVVLRCAGVGFTGLVTRGFLSKHGERRGERVDVVVLP